MMKGISKEAFENDYLVECREIIKDVPYGKALRWLAIKGSNLGLMDSIIKLGRTEIIMENALYNCVSAHKSFKEIFRETWNIKLILKIMGILFKFFLKKIIFVRKFDSYNM